MSADERFDSFVSPEPNSGCWLWTGSTKTDRNGVTYGRFWLNGRHIPAHGYKLDCPAGFERHHRCRCTLCVNPGHVEILPRRDHRALENRRRKHE